MSRKAFFQALESVSDNTINKQWKPQTNNGIKSMTPFMAILGYKLHTNYEYTKKVYNMNKRYCNGIESQFYNDYTKLSNNVDISYENFIKTCVNEFINNSNYDNIKLQSTEVYIKSSINRHMFEKILNILRGGINN